MKFLNSLAAKNIIAPRFRKIANKYLLTNDWGNFVFLDEPLFKNFLEGKSLPEYLYLHLQGEGFFKKGMNTSYCIHKYRKRNIFLRQSGPSLHIVVSTLRCNYNCLYCHASSFGPGIQGRDMTEETAKKVVDFIFESQSPLLKIEFQGGEPLLNWKIVKFIIKGALKKNEIEMRDLRFVLVSNLSLLNDEKLKFLLRHKVDIGTSIDGPEFLHNKNRPLVSGNSYQEAVRKLKRIRNLQKKKKVTPPSGALITITKYSLHYPKEIVDEYVNLGLESIYLRPLNPIGFAKKIWSKIGYSSSEFLSFYKKAMDYILDLNLAGKKIKEALATTFLKKILTDDDAGHMDYRSPCGAAIGQIAYNYNGDIYTCDEGRMIAEMGDEIFKLGNVCNMSYNEIMTNEIIKGMSAASCLDGLPGCEDCVYKPYCGVCPVYNYIEQGNIFGQMPTNERCKINKGIFDYLFKKMMSDKYRDIFKEWVS